MFIIKTLLQVSLGLKKSIIIQVFFYMAKFFLLEKTLQIQGFTS
jgi:hypothetical protein